MFFLIENSILGVKLRYRIVILLIFALISPINLLSAHDYFFENDSALYRSIHKDLSAVLFVEKSPHYFDIYIPRRNYHIIDMITEKPLNKCSNIEEFCKINY